MNIIRTSICAGLAIMAQPAFAAAFLDLGPTSTSQIGNELVNQAEDKNFAPPGSPPEIYPQQNIMTQFTLTQGMTLTGMDIFTRSQRSPYVPENRARLLGTPVTIKIRADVGGRPADTNLVRLLSSVNETSAVFADVTAWHMRLHADFATTALGPGTYWIGMSGTNVSLNWMHIYNVVRADKTYTLRGEAVIASLGADNTALFGLHGFVTPDAPPVASTVPEPASWAMLLGGFAMTGIAVRRQRRLIPA